ncbi:transglycosylase SLT domain-containing protein [Streptomyces sp. NPDC101393]|uniref:transglycosylase SLT domain-containing protein n=1 Tax=Streptomyces sp. NPDC101393 TaxID=3366141 RepID=UPI0037FD01BC
MPKHALSGFHRLTRTRKLSVAGVAAAGAAALVFTVVPGADAGQGKAEATTVEHVKPVAFSAVGTAAKTQQATITKQADATAAKAKAEAAAAAKKKAEAEKAAKAKAAADAKAKAEKARKAKEAASRSAERAPAPAPKPAPKKYADNLDGWIRESLDIMAKHNIPGSYDGIHRNIIRESGGNPMAINNWDINAQNGVPSKGLLQVIQPTFDTYHVAGTPNDLYDPVANIVAACNYAAATYGSMDNVNSAY